MHAIDGFRRRKTLVLVSGAFVLSSLGAAKAAEQNVSWTRPANVAIRGNMLEKTGGCDGCDDAGAVSRQMIRSGNDGYVEFRVTDPYTFWVGGLSQSNASPRFNDIDFAFRFNGNGWADVLENGRYQSASDTDVNAGDVFRIAVVNGRVEYMKNGQMIHESRRAPRYPLVAATAIGTIGTRVAAARIESSAPAFAATDQAATDQYGSFDSSEFATLDRNRDGMISRAEWSGPPREFLLLDSNRDNRISRAEYGEPANESTVGTSGNSEFASLDRNRDGAISRAEWSGSLREFLLLDSDRDNRISRNEYGAESTYGSTVGTSGRQVVVDSRDRWTNTGIFVEAGDVISFDADGSVQLSTNGNDVASPAGAARQAAEAPLQSRPAGMLIARVGNSAPIAVGVHRTMRAPVSGQIFLGVNDDHLPDNSGTYQVSITIEPR